LGGSGLGGGSDLLAHDGGGKELLPFSGGDRNRWTEDGLFSNAALVHCVVVAFPVTTAPCNVSLEEGSGDSWANFNET